MLFMNEWDIENTVRRLDPHDTPNLAAGAATLKRLQEWTDNNSDGWHLWVKPCRSAKNLMELLKAADDFDPTDCNVAELNAAYRPIKAMLTRTGITGANAAVFPKPTPEPVAHRTGICLDAESVRAEVAESPSITVSDARVVAAFSDDTINSWIHELADDAFWSAYDELRSRVITRLLELPEAGVSA